MPGTELIVGLWLHGLKQKECASTVSRWRRELLRRGPAANEDLTDEDREERIGALRTLERACKTCSRDCPIRPPKPPLRTLKVVGERRI